GRQRRRGHSPALPGVGEAIFAGTSSGEVCRRPAGVRMSARSEHAPALSPVRGRQRRKRRGHHRGGFMPEFPPPSVPGDTLVASEAALNEQAIESLLADFRAWLEQAAHADLLETVDDTPQPVDLATLLGQFVALRHEVNLQTRSSRATQEQNSETLRQLTEALELLQNQPEARPEAEEREQSERLRPLLKTLVDVHDALALARREVLRGEGKLLP